MRKRLILAGGGHAHLHTLSRLDLFHAAGIDVTCVAPTPHLAYSGMGPGMLSGRYAPSDLRFDIEAMAGRRGEKMLPAAGGDHPPRPPRAGKDGADGEGTLSGFIRGAVVRVVPEERRLVLEDGRELTYDAVSFGLGSRVVVPFPVETSPRTAVFPVKPIENLLAARRHIESLAEAGPVRVLVAGGGPSGFEVAANVLGLFASCGVKKPLVAVAVGRGLLCGWPRRARRAAIRSLRRRGARIVCGRVVRLAGGRAQLASGAHESCDVLLVATGTRPPELFSRCGLALSPDGGLTVNAFLQSPMHPEIFGGGDCVQFGPRELPRAGVYAVRQGPILCANLLAYLTGGKLLPFRQTGTNFLALLNCGDGRAILRKGPFVFEGAWCMALKDWIDRGFIQSFPPRRPPA
ncbi:Pyridine nucleotide-disulfide oxidoreductase family protein [Solidesulfovibrio carbinoliphilus subsp. oakridgensis]|uniref:Pyridine nucleotide-disulfide oxidoreductase family protein n=1 Tax=Solidesulfovibrio carbinoliphilus subsp. oakridgensis TaxID=694327 RepID=G7Q840_9BACT|nr:FAD-dependent oxidoreductase [Solidesulfovibrio carbinoliphilus]EHJ48054.1 Pyridine nucleotide-disulfide oxidoreductase family protein [Solidesulfovibrio carbinoliphilus subsp. oakridgensis]